MERVKMMCYEVVSEKSMPKLNQTDSSFFAENLTAPIFEQMLQTQGDARFCFLVDIGVYKIGNIKDKVHVIDDKIVAMTEKSQFTVKNGSGASYRIYYSKETGALTIWRL